MNRLFTFGCSFTNYCWPTWAELLALDYDYFENWGVSGIGNRGIAERVAECHAKNIFNENDTIIVQWSSHVRHDWYKDIYNKEENRIEGWGVYYDSTSYDKNKKILDFTFTDKAYIINTLNMIVLVQSLLESTKCNWVMTSIGDIRNLGYDNIFSKKDDTSIDNNIKELIKNKNDWVLWKQFPDLKFYNDLIWNKYNLKWLEPIFKTVTKNKNTIWTFEKDGYIDFHPTPDHHNEWLTSNLTINEKNNSDREYITSKFNKLKNSTNYTFEEFSDVSELLMNKLGKLKYHQLAKKDQGM